MDFEFTLCRGWSGRARTEVRYDIIDTAVQLCIAEAVLCLTLYMSIIMASILQPEDIAECVLLVACLPWRANIPELVKLLISLPSSSTPRDKLTISLDDTPSTCSLKTTQKGRHEVRMHSSC